jgi:hypothetical protein
MDKTNRRNDEKEDLLRQEYTATSKRFDELKTLPGSRVDAYV